MRDASGRKIIEINNNAQSAAKFLRESASRSLNYSERAALQEAAYRLLCEAYTSALSLGPAWHSLQLRICRQLAETCTKIGRQADAAEYYRHLPQHVPDSLTTYGRAKYGQIRTRRRIHAT